MAQVKTKSASARALMRVMKGDRYTVEEIADLEAELAALGARS